MVDLPSQSASSLKSQGRFLERFRAYTSCTSRGKVWKRIITNNRPTRKHIPGYSRRSYGFRPNPFTFWISSCYVIYRYNRPEDSSESTTKQGCNPGLLLPSYYPQLTPRSLGLFSTWNYWAQILGRYCTEHRSSHESDHHSRHRALCTSRTMLVHFCLSNIQSRHS